MTPDELMREILTHLQVINDANTTPPTRAAHGEWLAERVEQLDTVIVTGGGLPSRWQSPRTLTSTTTRRGANHELLVGPEAEEYKHTRRREPRRDDATHPRELPDPADEAAYARYLAGTGSLDDDELKAIEELLEPVGQHAAEAALEAALTAGEREAAARRAPREDA